MKSRQKDADQFGKIGKNSPSLEVIEFRSRMRSQENARDAHHRHLSFLPNADVIANQYGMYTFEEQQKMSFCDVTKPVDEKDRTGSVLDSRLEKQKGLIRIHPTYNPAFIKVLPRLLLCICIECGNALFDRIKDDDPLYKLVPAKPEGLYNTIVATYGKGECEKCKRERPTIEHPSKKTVSNVIQVVSKRSQINDPGSYRSITETEMIDLLRKVHPEYVSAQLGFERTPGALKRAEAMPDGDEKISALERVRVENNEQMVATFVLQGITVPPLDERPLNATPGSPSNNITIALDNIVKKNNAVPRSPEMNRDAKLADLYVAVNNLLEGADKQRSNNAGRNVIRTILDKKEGLVRGNLNRKRNNQSARTVMSPAEFALPDELYVPESMRDQLTPRVFVTSFNINYLQALQQDGQIKAIRSFSDGQYVSVPPGKLAEYKLQIKDKVYRFLQEGDMVNAIRNPTLQTQGMFVFRVKFWKQQTFGIALSVYQGYSGDFDGDTMSIYLNDDELSRSEGMFINCPRANHFSRVTGSSMNGPTYDAPLGAYVMTKDDQIDQITFEACLATASDLPQFKTLAERLSAFKDQVPPTSGRALFSACLPAMLVYETDKVIIRQGILIRGQITAPLIQKGHNSLLKHIAHQYDDVEVSQFVRAVTRMIGVYMSRSSISLAFDDMILDMDTDWVQVATDQMLENLRRIKKETAPDQMEAAIVAEIEITTSNMRTAVQNRIRKQYEKDKISTDDAKRGIENNFFDAYREFEKSLPAEKRTQISNEDLRGEIQQFMTTSSLSAVSKLIVDMIKSRFLENLKAINLDVKIDSSTRLNAMSKTYHMLQTDIQKQSERFTVLASDAEGSTKSKLINNIGQILASIGQQYIEGLRPPMTFLGRSNSYESPYGVMNLPGYIRSGFAKGLNPLEFMDASLTARKSLIDQNNTSTPGFLSARIERALSNLIIDQNGSAAWLDGRIVTLSYPFITTRTWLSYKGNNVYRTPFNLPVLSQQLLQEGGYQVDDQDGRGLKRTRIDALDMLRQERVAELKRRKTETANPFYKGDKTTSMLSTFVKFDDDVVTDALRELAFNADVYVNRLMPTALSAIIFDAYVSGKTADDNRPIIMGDVDCDLERYRAAFAYTLQQWPRVLEATFPKRPLISDAWYKIIFRRVVKAITLHEAKEIFGPGVEDFNIGGDDIDKVVYKSMPSALPSAENYFTKLDDEPISVTDKRSEAERQWVTTELDLLQQTQVRTIVDVYAQMRETANWVARHFVLSRSDEIALLLGMSDTGNFQRAVLSNVNNVVAHLTQLTHANFEQVHTYLASEHKKIVLSFESTTLGLEMKKTEWMKVVTENLEQQVRNLMYNLHDNFLPVFAGYKDTIVAKLDTNAAKRFQEWALINAYNAVIEESRFQENRKERLRMQNSDNAAHLVRDLSYAIYLMSKVSKDDDDLALFYKPYVRRVAHAFSAVIEEWYQQWRRAPSRQALSSGVAYLKTVDGEATYFGDMYAFEQYIYVFHAFYAGYSANNNQIRFDQLNKDYHDMITEDYLPDGFSTA